MCVRNNMIIPFPVKTLKCFKIFSSQASHWIYRITESFGFFLCVVENFKLTCQSIYILIIKWNICTVHMLHWCYCCFTYEIMGSKYTSLELWFHYIHVSYPYHVQMVWNSSITIVDIFIFCNFILHVLSLIRVSGEANI